MRPLRPRPVSTLLCSWLPPQLHGLTSTMTALSSCSKRCSTAATSSGLAAAAAAAAPRRPRVMLPAAASDRGVVTDLAEEKLAGAGQRAASWAGAPNAQPINWLKSNVRGLRLIGISPSSPAEERTLTLLRAGRAFVRQQKGAPGRAPMWSTIPAGRSHCVDQSASQPAPPGVSCRIWARGQGLLACLTSAVVTAQVQESAD